MDEGATEGHIGRSMAQIPLTASLRPGQCSEDSNSLVQVHDLELACETWSRCWPSQDFGIPCAEA